jgi:hypothetical protein
VLIEFGAPAAALGIQPADLQRQNSVIQFGLPSHRIDLLTSLSGIADFDTAWATRVERQMRDRKVPFFGRQALLDNQRASGRTKDLADVEALREAP